MIRRGPFTTVSESLNHLTTASLTAAGSTEWSVIAGGHLTTASLTSSSDFMATSSDFIVTLHCLGYNVYEENNATSQNAN
jgi:hypothetical protein